MVGHGDSVMRSAEAEGVPNLGDFAKLISEAGRGYSWELMCYGPPLPPHIAERRLKLNIHLNEFDKIEYWDGVRASMLEDAEREAAQARAALDVAEERVQRLRHPQPYRYGSGVVAPETASMAVASRSQVGLLATPLTALIDNVKQVEGARVDASVPLAAAKAKVAIPPLRVKLPDAPRKKRRKRADDEGIGDAVTDSGITEFVQLGETVIEVVRADAIQKEPDKRYINHVCTQCPRGFRTGKDLSRHQATVHGLREYHYCVCTERFVRRDFLIRHVNARKNSDDEHRLDYWTDASGQRREADYPVRYGLARLTTRKRKKQDSVAEHATVEDEVADDDPSVGEMIVNTKDDATGVIGSDTTSLSELTEPD